MKMEVVVQLVSCVRLFATPRAAVHQVSLSFTISQLVQTHVHRINDAIQPCRPLSPPSPPTLSLFQYQGLFQIPKNGRNSVYRVDGLLVSFSYSNFTFLSDLINIDIPQHHIFIMSQTNIISPPQ